MYSPILFQGSLTRRRYFEGWYFKHVSADRRSVMAFIPGVSLSRDDSHAFVQLIDGTTGATRYFPLPLSSFSAQERPFQVRVGESTFSLSGLDVRLDGPEGRVRASLSYAGVTPLPPRPLWPGIMGPFAFAPFMECYHGIGSLDHGVEGGVEVDGAALDFSGGRGYIEKDWGRSMPSAWVWCQSNTFRQPGTCLLFSLARIPWLGRSFPGFFALLREGGRIHRFATYTGARLEGFTLAGRELHAVIRDRRARLVLNALRSHEGVLKAPVDGAMDRRIGESIDARVRVRLERGGVTVLDETGECAGLEVVGDMRLLAPARAALRTASTAY
jgi:tocopherol cyclase